MDQGSTKKYDAFISYASRDKVIALSLCHFLEREKYKCFIAPRDMVAGKSYAEQLIDGIVNSIGLILIFSDAANRSSHVAREVERAASKNIPILAVIVEDKPLCKALEYFLSWLHWINGSIPLSANTLREIANTLQAWKENDTKNKKSKDPKEMIKEIYDFEMSRSLKKEIVESGNEDYKSALLGSEKHKGYDIANEVSWILKKFPLIGADEEKIINLSEKLFRRPAFYSHPERHWGYALYAIVKTRIVWEQELIPRLSRERLEGSYKVLAILLELEDFHASVIGITGTTLTELTARYICFKPAFVNNLQGSPSYKNLGLEKAFELTMKRNDLLRKLSNTLQNLGMGILDLGSPSAFSYDV